MEKDTTGTTLKQATPTYIDHKNIFYDIILFFFPFSFPLLYGSSYISFVVHSDDSVYNPAQGPSTYRYRSNSPKLKLKLK